MAAQESVWEASQAGTTAGATATKAALSATRAFMVTWISGYTDIDSLITILAGSTVKDRWNLDISINGPSFHIAFPKPGLPIAPGETVSGVIASSTAACFVSIGGTVDP